MAISYNFWQERLKTLKNRISESSIEKTIMCAKEKWPNEKIYITTDLEAYDFKIYDNIEIIKNSNSFNFLNKKVICIYNSDETASFVLKKITTEGGQYFTPIQYEPPAHYLNKNNIALQTISEDLSKAQADNCTHFEPEDFANIIQAINATRKLNGCYLEIGVFKGDSSYTTLNYMAKIEYKQKCFFIDTFEGFAYAEAKNSVDIQWENTHTDTSITAVNERLSSFKDLVNFELIKSNIISDKLPKKIESISICNIDVDMFEAVEAALIKVSPLMCKGGIIIAEDYGHTPGLGGAVVATDNFLNSKEGQNYVPIYLSSGQLFLIKIQ